MRGAHAISDRQLSSIRLAVRVETPLHGAHETVAPVYVGERRGEEVSVGADGPVRRDAPYGIGSESVTSGRTRDRSLLAFETVVVVVEEGPDLKLPLLGHSADGHPVPGVEGALLGLEVGAAVGIDLDRPMVPGVFRRLCLLGGVLF